jgi:thioredoxin-dependent peroxiredoxin
VQIVGVSRDSVESHQRFKARYQIPFALIADVDSKLCDAFGVIVERNLDGKVSRGIQRSTFLFDAGGQILREWPKVSVEGHAQEVYASIP